MVKTTDKLWRNVRVSAYDQKPFEKWNWHALQADMIKAIPRGGQNHEVKTYWPKLWRASQLNTCIASVRRSGYAITPALAALAQRLINTHIIAIKAEPFLAIDGSSSSWNRLGCTEEGSEKAGSFSRLHQDCKHMGATQYTPFIQRWAAKAHQGLTALLA